MVAGDVLFPENIVYEDDGAIVFLDGYPRAYGYTLVAPKEHREQVTADFAPEEYLRLQSLVYRVAEAVREEVGRSACTSTRSAAIRGTRTSTGTWYRCRRGCRTRSSRGRGLVGTAES